MVTGEVMLTGGGEVIVTGEVMLTCGGEVMLIWRWSW